MTSLGGLLDHLQNLSTPTEPDELFTAIIGDAGGTASLEKINTAFRRLLQDEGLDDSEVAIVDGMLASSESSESVMQATVDEMTQILQDRANEAYQLFQAWDTNLDGGLARDELHMAAPWIGLGSYLPAEVDALFASFDADNSGELSFRELFRLLKFKLPTRRRKPPTEKPADIAALRVTTSADVFHKASHLWTNEVPANLRSKASFRPKRANPSIGYTIL